MWSANVQRLQAIKTTNPLFYQYLVRLASCLKGTSSSSTALIGDQKESDGKYLDDHGFNSPVIRTVNGILIVESYVRHNNTVKATTQKEIDRMNFHPWNWATNTDILVYRNHVSCKNPLYIDEDDKVHLTTCATGTNIEKEDCEILRNGGVLKQERPWSLCDEYNFIVPYDVFVSTMLA